MLYAEFAEGDQRALAGAHQPRAARATARWTGIQAEASPRIRRSLRPLNATELIPARRHRAQDRTEGHRQCAAPTTTRCAPSTTGWSTNAHREPKVRGCGDRRHQGHARDAATSAASAPTSMRSSSASAARWACRRATSMACASRPRPSATGAGRQPGQPQGCAALPRRGLPQGARLGRDGSGRRAKVMRQETPRMDQGCEERRRGAGETRGCSAAGRATGWAATPATT